MDPRDVFCSHIRIPKEWDLTGSKLSVLLGATH
jgi:hypothetical protein